MKVMKVFNLGDEEKALLLKIAKKSIEDRLRGDGEGFLQSDSLSSSLTPNLRERAGVFVTLMAGGKHLRGCIGNFISDIPLYINVYKMAREAAFADPRFFPLTLAELHDVKLEISVLSPLEKIDNLENIEIGKHGLYIIKGPCHGVLLPQVATECCMDRKGFLEAVSLKAGLPPDGYKDGADICTFSAIVFGE